MPGEVRLTPDTPTTLMRFDRPSLRDIAWLVFYDVNRTLGGLFFLNRYGPALIDRLLESLPLEQGRHWVLTI